MSMPNSVLSGLPPSPTSTAIRAIAVSPTDARHGSPHQSGSSCCDTEWLEVRTNENILLPVQPRELEPDFTDDESELFDEQEYHHLHDEHGKSDIPSLKAKYFQKYSLNVDGMPVNEERYFKTLEKAAGYHLVCKEQVPGETPHIVLWDYYGGNTALDANVNAGDIVYVMAKEFPVMLLPNTPHLLTKENDNVSSLFSRFRDFITFKKRRGGKNSTQNTECYLRSEHQWALVRIETDRREFFQFGVMPMAYLMRKDFYDKHTNLFASQAWFLGPRTVTAGIRYMHDRDHHALPGSFVIVSPPCLNPNPDEHRPYLMIVNVKKTGKEKEFSEEIRKKAIKMARGDNAGFYRHVVRNEVGRAQALLKIRDQCMKDRRQGAGHDTDREDIASGIGMPVLNKTIPYSGADTASEGNGVHGEVDDTEDDQEAGTLPESLFVSSMGKVRSFRYQVKPNTIPTAKSDVRPADSAKVQEKEKARRRLKEKIGPMVETETVEQLWNKVDAVAKPLPPTNSSIHYAVDTIPTSGPKNIVKEMTYRTRHEAALERGFDDLAQYRSLLYDDFVPKVFTITRDVSGGYLFFGSRYVTLYDLVWHLANTEKSPLGTQLAFDCFDPALLPPHFTAVPCPLALHRDPIWLPMQIEGMAAAFYYKYTYAAGQDECLSTVVRSIFDPQRKNHTKMAEDAQIPPDLLQGNDDYWDRHTRRKPEEEFSDMTPAQIAETKRQQIVAAAEKELSEPDRLKLFIKQSNIIKPNHVRRYFNEELGKGEFGVVYYADYILPRNKQITFNSLVEAARDCFDNKDDRRVERMSTQDRLEYRRQKLLKRRFDGITGAVVKKIKFRSKIAVDWANEIVSLQATSHPNIVRFYGFFFDEPYSHGLNIVVEFADGGSLQGYIRELKGEFHMNELADLCAQITRGMSYLHALEPAIVHGDLAARNVLLKHHAIDKTRYICKITDFGLAKKTTHDFCSTYDDPMKVPYKWLPPEVLKGRELSIFTDIWAFGILCLEFFFPDGEPYGTKEPAQYVPLHKDGYCHDRPRNCPEFMWAMMRRCWRFRPSERVHFCEMAAYFPRFIIEYESSYIDMIKSRPMAPGQLKRRGRGARAESAAREGMPRMDDGGDNSDDVLENARI